MYVMYYMYIMEHNKPYELLVLKFSTNKKYVLVLRTDCFNEVKFTYHRWSGEEPQEVRICEDVTWAHYRCMMITFKNYGSYETESEFDTIVENLHLVAKVSMMKDNLLQNILEKNPTTPPPGCTQFVVHSTMFMMTALVSSPFMAHIPDICLLKQLADFDSQDQKDAFNALFNVHYMPIAERSIVKGKIATFLDLYDLPDIEVCNENEYTKLVKDNFAITNDYNKRVKASEFHKMLYTLRYHNDSFENVNQVNLHNIQKEINLCCKQLGITKRRFADGYYYTGVKDLREYIKCLSDIANDIRQTKPQSFWPIIKKRGIHEGIRFADVEYAPGKTTRLGGFADVKDIDFDEPDIGYAHAKLYSDLQLVDGSNDQVCVPYAVKWSRVVDTGTNTLSVDPDIVIGFMETRNSPLEWAWEGSKYYPMSWHQDLKTQLQLPSHKQYEWIVFGSVRQQEKEVLVKMGGWDLQQIAKVVPNLQLETSTL
jgi:hypothetical protein